jgi:hypothetical protein
MAAYQDLYLDKGMDFTENITLADDYGNPYNLSLFLVKAQGKISYYTSNVALLFTSTISDAANGVVTLSANNAITSNVIPNNSGKLVYDVFIKDTISSKVTRVLEGQIFISPAVSGF